MVCWRYRSVPAAKLFMYVILYFPLTTLWSFIFYIIFNKHVCLIKSHFKNISYSDEYKEVKKKCTFEQLLPKNDKDYMEIEQSIGEISEAA